MKKYLLGGCLIMAAIFSYTACLNPVNFNEEQLPTIHIDGSLDTNNVTRGSTYIVNLSKSLNFTNVVITQTENQALATNEEPYLVSKFPNTKDSTGNWKKVKAKYVQPSDIEYEVEVKIIDGSDEAGPSFSKSTDLLATMPGMVYYIWIYRTKDQAYIDSQIAAGVPAEFADVVVTSPQNPNPPPALPFPSDDDTQNIEVNVGADNGNIVAALERISNTLVNVFVKESGPSPDDENGSVPPVISPGNRTAMGTFIVVNLSRTRNIDWVTFHEETTVGIYSNVYTIIPSASSAPGTTAVAAQDRKGIALKQGHYGITAGHNGTQTGSKTGIVVPSNDPQAIKEHYIYFYKARNGSYVLSVDRPDNSDIDPTDVLPPDAGRGVGIVTIINRTTSGLVDSISITSRDNPARGSMVKNYTEFKPSPQPISGNGSSGSVEFIGTASPNFPIDGYFFANVTLLTVEDVVTVQRLIYLNNSIAEIIITDADIGVSKVPGAKIAVTNNTTTTSVIGKIEIYNTAVTSEHADFTLAIANDGVPYSFNVLNSPGMPIVENYLYNAKLTVTVTKQFVGEYTVDGTTVRDPLISSTGIVTKSFTPDNRLYGKDGPDTWSRFIVLSELDIASIIPAGPPSAPPPSTFVPVSDVIILNGEVQQPNGEIKFFAKDGTARQLFWKVLPEEATNKDGYWTLGELDLNVLLKQGHYSLTREGSLKVNSSWSYEYLYVAFIIPNGIAQGSRSEGIHRVGNMQYLKFDNTKDFVKVFKLVTPPPIVVTPPPPPTNTATLLLNYVGNGAGSGDKWSVNLIEVYKRPQYIYKKDGTGAYTLHGDPVEEKGYLRYGSYLTGKTGWHWQANPYDDLSLYWGGTTEGWVTTNPPPADQLQGVSARNDYAHEIQPSFLDSISLVTGQAHQGSAKISGSWLVNKSSDGKLNQAGEKYGLTVPTDQGPLWIRLRMDYHDSVVGYWWKAVYLQEWFVFDPSTAYKKENGAVVIDVDLYNTPYMQYRK